MSVLDKIDFPKDIKKLNKKELVQLCDELRQKIIGDCATNPGHLGSSLGVVEMTVAIHYVFDTPYDNLVWDVGHQAYAHKILTGRKEQFKNKRLYGGISGFPRMSESEYDSFGTGHSSTSISAALGMAIAAKMNKEDNRQSIAVIGDGSMTGGMAFEALNNASISDSNILIILNDNNMAIDPNVGGLTNYLLHMTTSKTYNRLKGNVWNGLGKLAFIGRGVRKFFKYISNGAKSILLKESNFFEALGLRYFGPVDGHDVNQLIKILKDLKDIKGPKILHCITTKGKGFKMAEDHQTTWHAPGKFDIETGERFAESKENTPPRFQDVFGHTLLELAKQNEGIVGITPAMPTGCSLTIMMREMPDKCFDVGIAEQHAVTFAAGLATKGMVPFCNIYSSFMQRAFDQVIHDIALQKLNVVLCLDRAGLVDYDGATHHGAYDLAYMRLIPNLTIAAPLNEEELRNMMYTAQLPNQGPFTIRYPRGNGFMKDWETPLKELTIGKGQCIKKGKDIAILSIGTIGNFANKVLEQEKYNDVALYDARFLKPLDEELLHTVLKTYPKLICIEDGCINGGFSSAVAEFMKDNNYHNKLIRLGIPDRFIEHGTQAQLYKDSHIGEDAIIKALDDLQAML